MYHFLLLHFLGIVIAAFIASALNVGGAATLTGQVLNGTSTQALSGAAAIKQSLGIDHDTNSYI